MQAQRLAAKAKAAGYNALAFQWDYPAPPGVSREALWGMTRDECLHRAILPGVWVTQPVNALSAPTDCRFLIVEDERPDQRAFILDHIPELKGFGVPLGVVTNGHYDPTLMGAAWNKLQWAPIRAGGFAYLGEVYARTDAGVATSESLATMQYRAWSWQGVPPVETAPVYGRFGGATYDQAERASQQAFWDWPVEGVLANA